MGKPKIRFKGYTDEWEQRKFGKIVEKYEDPVETPTDGYMRLGIRSHAKGTFHNYVEKGKELETAKMFRVAADKFIVNITFGWEHAVAITDENDAGMLVSHRFPQYSFNEGMIPKFFKYLILDENFKHHLELSSPGGAGRNRVLKLSDMLEYKMNFPSEAEQKKIAIYFDDLDNLITLHQRKYEQAKTLKKYMLQKMFPQDGMRVPEIRFAGFTDEWEQRKFSDCAQRESLFQTSSYDCPSVEYEDVIAEEGCLNKDIRLKEVQKTGIKFDGTQVLYGKLRPYLHNWLNPDFMGVAVGDWWVFRPVEIDKNFLYRLIQTKKFDNVANQSSGSKMPRADWNLVSQSEFIVPISLEEQCRIAEAFEELDRLITLHQRKCDELRKIKKYMLQNMFC